MKNSARSDGGLEKSHLEALRQKIAELVVRDPKKAAIILTDWMSRGSAVTSPAPSTRRRKAG